VKKWIVALALLIVCNLGWAATAEKKTAAKSMDICAGVKVGMSLANLSGDDIDGTSSKIGLAAGGFAGFGIGPLTIQPEVLYVQKGAQGEDNSDVKLKLDYLEIPVLFKGYFMGPQAKVRPCIYAGPAVGILLSAKYDDGSDADAVDVKDGYKSTDFGVAMGAGIDIQGFTLDVRYTLGLTKLPDTGDSDVDVDEKNGAFMVLVGYSFL